MNILGKTCIIKVLKVAKKKGLYPLSRKYCFGKTIGVGIKLTHLFGVKPCSVLLAIYNFL